MFCVRVLCFSIFILCNLATVAKANNNFSSTVPIGGTQISGISGSLIGSNVGANSQTGEPANYGNPIESIWYSWTATNTGTVIFETCGNPQTSFDTTLQSFVGNAVNALGTPLATNDDSAACPINGGNNLGSRISFDVTAGTVYHIQVDGYNSAEGTFRLNWSLASFNVAKSASASSISAAGPITYSIAVTNTGARALTTPSLLDTLLLGTASRTLTTGPTLASGDTDADGEIDTNEIWVYTATYTATQADMDLGGTFSNSVTFDTAQTPARTSNAATTTIVQTPALSINKTFVISPDSGTIGVADLGDVITYTYAVTNSGNITVANVNVTDVHNAAGPLSTITPTNVASLAPGTSASFTATYVTLQGDIDNQ
jgi:hypothetical protein